MTTAEKLAGITFATKPRPAGGYTVYRHGEAVGVVKKERGHWYVYAPPAPGLLPKPVANCFTRSRALQSYAEGLLEAEHGESWWELDA